MPQILALPSTEQVLRASETAWQGTFENAAIGIAHTTLDGQWLLLNDALCRITGYSRDELQGTNFLQRLLAVCDAEVLVAATAREALALLRQEKPHVLISDIGMPKEDGYWLIEQVRALASEEGGSTPALALTALARAVDRIRALRAGFQAHTAKPVETAELVYLIAALAGRTTRRSRQGAKSVLPLERM